MKATKIETETIAMFLTKEEFHTIYAGVIKYVDYFKEKYDIIPYNTNKVLEKLDKIYDDILIFKDEENRQ